jgi:hypothetical protein
LTTSEAHIVLKEQYEGVAGGHLVVDITAKSILIAIYWWPTLSMILMTLAKVVIAIRKLEDSKQRVWPS